MVSNWVWAIGVLQRRQPGVIVQEPLQVSERCHVSCGGVARNGVLLGRAQRPDPVLSAAKLARLLPAPRTPSISRPWISRISRRERGSADRSRP